MPLSPEAMAIFEGVKAGNELIDALKRRLDDTDRSVVVELDNLTELTLRKVGDSHDSGGFDTTPAPIVNPKSHSLFTSQNTVPLEGTEGCVTYVGEGINDMTICWDHPFVGGIAARVVVKGPRENRYSLEATVGSGNVGAHMRYVLFDVEGPYSLREFLQKVHPDFFQFEELDLDKGSRHVFAFLKSKPPGTPPKSIREIMKV